MSATKYKPFIAFTAMMPCVLFGSLVKAKTVEAQVHEQLYSESADSAADIAAAESVAHRDHKRILLDFGGNWCGDCRLLDMNYRQPKNAELLAQHYVVVHIDIGHMDHNVAIADKYHVPIRRGIPALAALDARGDLIYVEQEKEFEHTSAEALQSFLERWK